jgi:hypothetical protein
MSRLTTRSGTWIHSDEVDDHLLEAHSRAVLKGTLPTIGAVAGLGTQLTSDAPWASPAAHGTLHWQRQKPDFQLQRELPVRRNDLKALQLQQNNPRQPSAQYRTQAVFCASTPIQQRTVAAVPQDTYQPQLCQLSHLHDTNTRQRIRQNTAHQLSQPSPILQPQTRKP